MTNLKFLRKEKGVSQQSVADFLGISRAQYTNIENGKRETNFTTLKKLAQFFNTTTDHILEKSNKYSFYDESNGPILAIPKSLEGVLVAFHQGEGEFTQEEINQLEIMVELFRTRRNKQKQEVEQ